MFQHPADHHGSLRLPSRFRFLRAFATKRSPGPRPVFDFDGLAKELASGLTRREALRRFALGIVAGLLAEFTDLLHGGWLAPAAAAPVASAGSCSSAQANACLQAAQASLTAALMGCILPAGGGVTLPWAQAAQSLNCLDQVGSQASQAQQDCLGPKAGCASNTFCSNNACCPAGLAGCGGQCCSDCCGGACCSSGQSCCFGGCVDTQADPSHCGGCGNVCPAGQSCVDGVCGGGGGSGQESGGTQGGAGQGGTAGGSTITGVGGPGGNGTCLQETFSLVRGLEVTRIPCSGCCQAAGTLLAPQNTTCVGQGQQTSKLCGRNGEDCHSCEPDEDCRGGICCKPCGSDCCTSGCCKNGACAGGSDQDACGSNGEVCDNCVAKGQACQNGHCVPSCLGPLGASCPGCCEYPRLYCHHDSLNNDMFCGAMGQPCDKCTDKGQECLQGHCCKVCRSSLQGKMCCDSGCCDKTLGCVAGADHRDAYCGQKGEPCQDCTENGTRPDRGCVDGHCCKVCRFGADKTCCETGCCDPQTGCHSDGDTNRQYCGSGGGPCQPCGPDEVCVNGICQKSGVSGNPQPPGG